MQNNDTIELLKECDQGVKMGIEAIDEVMPRVDDHNLEKILSDYKIRHEELKDELEVLLNDVGISGDEPNIMAKGMSKLKTNFKMMMEDSDRTVADLMTDGCDMGIKSLTKYLNQYESAEEKVKDITKKIIRIESDFEEDLKKYL